MTDAVAPQFRPLHDRVLVKRIDTETVSKGGILMPSNAQEKPTEGVIVAVGSGKALTDGTRATPPVQPGDKVLFGKYTGFEHKFDGEDYVIMSVTDIMGVLEE